MYSLVLCHSHLNRVALRDLFQAAYMKKFQKEMPPKSLDEDVETFNTKQRTPAYVVDFMLGVYGQH